MRLKVFFDGGCRPNPGVMRIAVVAQGRTHIVADAGTGTSFDAEWLALLHAVKIAQGSGSADCVLLGDALGVVNQANRIVRCPGRAIAHLRAFQALTTALRAPRVRYIKRTQNLAGIALDASWR